MLFLIPVGGGIPGGVLLAQKSGIGWPVMMGLYLVSDVILAFVFEPALRLVSMAGRRIPRLARVAEAFRRSMERTTAPYGSAAGPFALVMIAFGVDPMTGRTAAAAAGHGFVSGWILAITGDMMYFTVIMAATLKLSAIIGDPTLAVGLILAAMIFLPVLARRVKTLLRGA
jgi:hypothetical protein